MTGNARAASRAKRSLTKPKKYSILIRKALFDLTRLNSAFLMGNKSEKEVINYVRKEEENDTTSQGNKDYTVCLPKNRLLIRQKLLP